MTRPTIRHVAICTRDPAELAKFYRDVFQMEILHESKSGATYITDGHLTMALLPHRLEGEAAVGINHFGFQVDDAEAVNEALEAYGVERPKKRPSNRPYAEYRGVDPHGNQFDVSQHGYQKIEYRGDRESREKEPADA